MSQRLRRRTQVGIVGAGPAGLVLGHLLHRAGIDAVVLEARDRDYVEQRVRAGVLEQGTVDLLKRVGVGERMEREGLVHTGVELRFGGRGHRIAFDELTGGRTITIYGQQEVVKDLIAARLEAGAELAFEATGVSVHDIESDRPLLRYRHAGSDHELECDWWRAATGSTGYVARPSRVECSPCTSTTTPSPGSASSPRSRPRATS